MDAFQLQCNGGKTLHSYLSTGGFIVLSQYNVVIPRHSATSLGIHAVDVGGG